MPHSGTSFRLIMNPTVSDKCEALVSFFRKYRNDLETHTSKQILCLLKEEQASNQHQLLIFTSHLSDSYWALKYNNNNKIMEKGRWQSGDTELIRFPKDPNLSNSHAALNPANYTTPKNRMLQATYLLQYNLKKKACQYCSLSHLIKITGNKTKLS